MGDRRQIYIVDDEDAVRRSASFMLKIAGFAVATYASGPAFLRDVRTNPPGCVLLDVRMPEMDGLDVQQRLRDMGVALPVIILTGHGDIAIAVRAMKAGAIDFIEKPFEKAVLLKALETGFGRLESSVEAQRQSEDAQVRIAALTPREREVLQGLAEGLPNKTIAYDLGISARTVEVHRANLMTKLDVRSFSDALRIAFAAGLGRDPVQQPVHHLLPPRIAP